jgi:hypothetical protein
MGILALHDPSRPLLHPRLLHGRDTIRPITQQPQRRIHRFEMDALDRRRARQDTPQSKLHCGDAATGRGDHQVAGVFDDCLLFLEYRLGSWREHDSEYMVDEQLWLYTARHWYVFTQIFRVTLADER